MAKGRGSEIFVAAGNELRWAELGALKQDFQEIEETTRSGGRRTTYLYEGDGESAYRVR